MADWQKVINFAWMISLIEHIEYLIRHHNCVVIPQWGALIDQYSPSQLQASKIIKPKRKVAFNASIDHNDGLLANSLVRRHGISYDQALKLIANSVSFYKRQLQNGNEVAFGRIGYFTLNNNGSTEFTPFHQSNSIDEYFGLRSFTFKPLVSDSDVSSTEVSAADKHPHVVPSHSRNRFAYRALQVAASIAIILGIAFVASTPIAVDRSQQNYASLNMPAVIKKPNATPVFTSTPVSKVNREETGSANSKHNTETATETKESGKYYLVISTFSSEQKAKEFISLHADIKDAAKIRAKGKQYRVYIQRGDDYNVLYKAAKNLPSQYGGGWVTTD